MDKKQRKTVLFCHDTYYCRDKKGDIYAYGAFPYSLWAQRFLPHFDQIKIVGRDKGLCTPQATEGLDQSSGKDVEHLLFENINTPLKRLTQGRRLYRQIYQEVEKVDGVIIRGPVEFGMMAAKAARALGKPYAVEMSGCAFDHTWYHGSWIGKLYAPLKYLRARQMVAAADQVIYVTRAFLQRRYPSAAVQTYASNVEIKPSAPQVLEARLHKIKNEKAMLKIGLIGNYGNALKGLDVAFKALSRLKRDGYAFRFHILGEGDAARWQAEISRAGLEDDVVFDGTLPGGAPVLAWLDALDIYIQPSRHEGLSRALIEAMSRALPCLASAAGGSAELLPPRYIHKIGDDAALYQRLKRLWQDRGEQEVQARRNFQEAQNYTDAVLALRRAAFWDAFKARL